MFRTADAAAYLGFSCSSASRLLARLAVTGQLLSLRRGVWAVPGNLDPLALAGHLTAPFPSYVSLQSALYYHGLISQIPNVIYAVSVGRTRVFQTPLGTVSIHHLQPEFFFGFEVMETAGVSMAAPEKALLDYLYLRPARSCLFRALPELEPPASGEAPWAGDGNRPCLSRFYSSCFLSAKWSAWQGLHLQPSRFERDASTNWPHAVGSPSRSLGEGCCSR